MVAGIRWPPGPRCAWHRGRLGGHLPGDRDEDLRVLLAVPQVDRGGHLLKAEAPPAAIPEQISGHHRGPLPVALPQVGDQELLGIGAASIRWVVNRSASGSRQARPWANRCGSPSAARSAMVPDRRHSGPGSQLAWRQASRQYRSSARTLQRITRDRTRALLFLPL